MKHLKSLTSAGLALGMSGLFTALSSIPAIAAVPDGKAVFDRNCSVCHSVMPPPKSAPPIVPIASRYRQQYPSRSQGVARMVSFLKSPSKEKVLADPQAITRFGLMPPMQLSNAELNAVAGWVWDQGNAKGWGPGSGAGKGKGGCIQQQ
ncbi:MAG: cytochrome c [Chlorobiaceae bacterium]|nr:cytochrome c [Chlorobiales bacterium]NTU90655.1 cytochrome c [Chlorobiaceae bacterium]